MDKEVSFKIAKSLKEKGFDGFCNKWEPLDGEFMVFEYDDKKCVKIPSIGKVVMWLYENHNIWIYSFNEDCVEKTFGYNISLLDEEETELYSFDRVAKSIYSGVDGTRFKSPTDAYEAAIKYTLINII